MTFLELALALLKIANYIFGQIERQQFVKSGRDEEIARQAKAVLDKTELGKRINEQLEKLSDPEIDEVLERLAK